MHSPQLRAKLDACHVAILNGLPPDDRFETKAAEYLKALRRYRLFLLNRAGCAAEDPPGRRHTSGSSTR